MKFRIVPSSHVLMRFHLLLIFLFLIGLNYVSTTDTIPNLTTKQLETRFEAGGILVVFFYTRSCTNCKEVLTELDKIQPELKELNIDLVKTSERAAAKKFDVNKLPSLVLFKNKESHIYEGDPKQEETVFEWIAALDALDNPEKIEEVDSQHLQQYVDSHDYLAALFYKKNSKKSEKVLHELENIDDDASQKDIAFVKISDQALAFEYGLEEMPSLVYYRRKIPIVYQGDLENEEAVLEWLFEFRDTADDDEEDEKGEAVIEDVSTSILEKMIENSENLAVLFYDDTQEKSKTVLQELEKIDDDTDQHNIAFVKIDDREVAKRFGISPNEMPCLVYFENSVPNFYSGDLTKEETVLEWLIHQKNSDEIEDVSDVVLHQMIANKPHVAVLFYDKKSKQSLEALGELENIDDDCDKLGLPFVKIDDVQLAKEFGLDDELPALVYFEKQIPNLFDGDLKKEEKVLAWLQKQLNSDEIEEVSDKMLYALIDRTPHIAVLFYDKSNRKSNEVLKELERIDDDCDRADIVFVRTDDLEAAEKYNVKSKLPVVVFFENEVPTIYEGDLTKEEEVLKWLIEQQTSVEIEDINSKTLETLVAASDSLAVLFYDKDSPRSTVVLKELENIDDDTDKYDIPLVKIDDDKIAKEYGLMDELPIMVYFEHGLPTVYEGDLTKEEEVLEWLIKQKTEDTIEEVTEEILEDLVDEHPYVLVFYAPDECRDCADILKGLENIDDDTDDHGILFVTTDDLSLARKNGITKFPSLVLYRHGKPTPYTGSLKKPDDVLKWVTSEEALDSPDQIEQLNEKMLDKLLSRSQYVAVLFTRPKGCSDCEKVLHELEKIDHIAEENGIDFVRIQDVDVATEHHVTTFPALIFFKNRFPQPYDGDLKDEETVLKWMINLKGSKEDVIEMVDRKMLHRLIEDIPNIVVFFYTDPKATETVKILGELEKIDDDTDQHGIHFVKTDDIEYAKEIGITKTPSLVYFENGSPSIYEGDLTQEEHVLDWLVKQKNEDTIENVNRDILFKMIAEKEYLAVLFYKTNDDESEEILEHLENIDDDCSDYEVELVKISDNLIAKKYGVRNPPGLVFFRRGKPLKYEGDLFDEEEVLEWLTRPENMESADAIERVNRRMFDRLLGKINYLAVLFYSRTECKQCDRVLDELEKIDDEADAAGIKFVKIEDPALARNFGVYALPALVFFKKGDENDPIIYPGDLKKSDKILDWLVSQKDPSLDMIEEVDGKTLRKLLASTEHIAVYFYSDDCPSCRAVLEDLENIDTDTDKHGIAFVKTKDAELAEEYGCKSFPALIYFEKQTPSVYHGDISAEEDVLQWLIQQRTEDTIESVNRELLENLIENSHYLVVFFYKPNCRACDIVLEELEHIDDECDIYGIQMVKIQDIPLAKRYGIRTFPALMYFRNGNPLLFDGDLRNEDSVLEWLIDDDNRELQDEIEDVNGRMLDKLVDESPFLVVFFYDDDCAECDEVLKELEKIDDDLDHYGIDFVKVNDNEAARKYRVHGTPALGYFRKKVPIFYDGDLTQEDKVLSWLTSEDVFELKDEIEEVNRKMLDKILMENDFVAVYFYEKGCYDCEEVLKELERIDDDADNLDIMFVKIRDPRYARKYGITNFPALVFFRKRFPSMYRGDLMKEEEVLEWLRRNRYRHPEINIFMYGLLAVTVGFVLYTIFLLFFMKPKVKKE
ncbi:hulk isoform X2 [Brevipalpus obovatus]|uniref:hulk isoform X2 n=1 Tax=Brevipalpus obovatus TaxID=246614 RepID=UPI003D9EF519